MRKIYLLPLSAAFLSTAALAATPINLQTCIADCASPRDQCLLSATDPDDPTCVTVYNRCVATCQMSDAYRKALTSGAPNSPTN